MAPVVTGAYSIVKFLRIIVQFGGLVYMFVILPILFVASLILAFGGIPPPLLWAVELVILLVLYYTYAGLKKLEENMKPVQAETVQQTGPQDI